jgi:hypothetical protein
VISRWPPFLVLCLVGHSLIRTANGTGWDATAEYVVWCVCTWITVGYVVDYVRWRIQNDNLRFLSDLSKEERR